MKIVLFTPGLGNQMFQYLFYLYLRDNYPNQNIYGYYNRNILNKHNGLEVDKVFDIQLPPHTVISCRKDLFLQSCTPQYYESAISVMKEKFQKPVFFVFSDDIPWVKVNLNIPNAYYIDWNKKENSYLDMYLMSLCTASIIANSTFSFWGAMLGNKKELVIKPKKWIGDEIPEIFPPSWLSL